MWPITSTYKYKKFLVGHYISWGFFQANCFWFTPNSLLIQGRIFPMAGVTTVYWHREAEWTLHWEIQSEFPDWNKVRYVYDGSCWVWVKTICILTIGRPNHSYNILVHQSRCEWHAHCAYFTLYNHINFFSVFSCVKCNWWASYYRNGSYGYHSAIFVTTRNARTEHYNDMSFSPTELL